MNHEHLTKLVLSLTIIVIYVAGCAPITQPSRFYILDSIADQTANRHILDKTVAVGPVRLPKYLDRPNLVTRVGDNQLNLAEYDRWAGSLKEDILRVIGENLSYLLSSERIAIYPWRRSALIDYQVEIEIIRLDGRLGQDASLNVRWAIYGKKGTKLLAARSSAFNESVDGDDYDALVAAWDRGLLKLSQEIADMLIELSEDQT